MATAEVFPQNVVGFETPKKRPSSTGSDPELVRQSGVLIHESLYSLLLDEEVRLNGYTCRSNEPELYDAETKKAFKALMGACKEFIGLHGQELKLSVEKLDMSDTAVCKTYHDTVCAIFETEINWGRIISAVCVSRTMALKAYRERRPFLIESIEGWLLTIMVERLQPWIIRHGGWGGFPDKFASGKKVTQIGSKSVVSPLLAVAVVGLGTLFVTSILGR